MHRPDWEELPRGDISPQSAGLHVTLNRRGNIVMNRFTHRRMGEPEACMVLFDRTNRRIGLRPTSPSFKNAYPLGPANVCGGRIVRAYRLLHQYQIDLPDTLEFKDADIDTDGVLILDLRTAAISNRARGYKKRIAPAK